MATVVSHSYWSGKWAAAVLPFCIEVVCELLSTYSCFLRGLTGLTLRGYSFGIFLCIARMWRILDSCLYVIRISFQSLYINYQDPQSSNSETVCFWRLSYSAYKKPKILGMFALEVGYGDGKIYADLSLWNRDVRWSPPSPLSIFWKILKCLRSWRDLWTLLRFFRSCQMASDDTG